MSKVFDEQLERRRQIAREWKPPLTKVKTRLDIDLGRRRVVQVFRFVTTYADGRPAVESPEYEVPMTAKEALQMSALYAKCAEEVQQPLNLQFGDNPAPQPTEGDTLD